MLRIAPILLCFLVLAGQLFSQKNSVLASLLETTKPGGIVRYNNADEIQRMTGLLDSFIVSKDYTLNKHSAETFLMSNFDSLKTSLNKNKWTIKSIGGNTSYSIGGTTYCTIKKDSFNYIAVLTTQDQQTMFSIKPLSENRSSRQFIQVNKLVASDRIITAEFGRAVSITNNYAVVGVKLEDNDVSGGNSKLDAGAAYIYERGPDNKWKQVQKIVASDRSQGANFGCSVGISGNTIIVGAIYERFDASGRNEASSEGAAYVFERSSDGVWKQIQKLVSSDRGGSTYFGSSVSIDGNIIVVGAPGHARDSTESQEGYVGNAGAIFVFEKKGNSWRRTYKLVSTDRQPGDGLGNSISIKGNYVIAGVRDQDFDADGKTRMESSGAAYIWERMDDGKWTKALKIVASDRTPYDEFGFSVDISNDNAIVGAKGVTLKRTDEDNNPNSGEAYIFSRNETGKWIEVSAIIPDDRMDRDLYGNSVGISGNYAIVGSPMGNTKKGDVGVIYVYWKNQQEKWIQLQKISASDERIFSNFGGAAAIHKGFIITGAHVEPRDADGKNELSNSGAAYIFSQSDKANPVTPKPLPKKP